MLLLLYTLLLEHMMWYWGAALVIDGIDRSVTFWDVWRVLFNQVFINAAMLWAVWDLLPDETSPRMILCAPVVYLVEELAFYACHRLFHTRYFYALHKTHHAWVTTTAWCAVDCHPLEHAACNFGPILLGPCLVGWSKSLVRVWALVATLNTVWVHRSHTVNQMNSNPDASHHAIHHARQRFNYGVSPWVDRMLGTYCTDIVAEQS